MAIRREIAAYAAQDERFHADVLDQVRLNTTAILESREASADDHAFQRSECL